MLGLNLSLFAQNTAALTGGTPTPTGPAITGTAEQFSTLSTDASSPQWQRGASGFFYDIPGATSSTYQLGYGDVGMSIRVRDGTVPSDPTSAVTEKPVFFDTFTEAGTGTATIAGHQADIGGTWFKHPSAVDGVSINKDTDRAVGSATSGSNYFINSADQPFRRIRIKTTFKRTSGIGSILVGFNTTGTFNGYRFYNDGGWSLQRATNGTFTTIHSTGFASLAGVTTDVPLNVTFEEVDNRVRVRYRSVNHTVEPIQADDSDALRKSVDGGALGLGPRTGTEFDDFTVYQVDDSPVVTENGIWTWYNDPRAVYHGGRDYVGHIDSAGSINLSKIEANGTTTQVSVGVANSPADDHNNPGLLVLPSGRLMVGYCDHQDLVGSRYKVSTNALPDISSFGSEVTIASVPTSGTEVSYVNLYMLSDNVVRLIRRGYLAQYEWCYASAASVEAGTASWTTQTIIAEGHAYAKMVQSTDNHRLYFVFGTGHPDRNDTALYSFYIDVSSGTPVAKNLSGTTISLPVSRSNATLVRSTTTGGPNNWTWDISLGSDGHPRMLGTRYPNGQNDVSNVSYTNIEYWHYRWNGSAIVQTQIASNQVSLYAAQPFYAGGMCFDGNDATIIYMATLDADGYYQIGEYRMDEATATLTKVRNVTTRAIAHNARPFSPRNHGSNTSVYWWRGRYTDYIGYDTMLLRAGES